MATIRIVWGIGHGPTELAAYDAALADANVHNYNLVTISSIIPADATVERVGTAPSLGPAGQALHVVESRITTNEAERISAGLGWIANDGEIGIIYESAANEDERAIRTRLTDGLAAATDYRTMDDSSPSFQITSTHAEPGTYTTAVVLAVYGRGRSLF